jgi:hypothetical protein
MISRGLKQKRQEKKVLVQSLIQVSAQQMMLVTVGGSCYYYAPWLWHGLRLCFLVKLLFMGFAWGCHPKMSGRIDHHLKDMILNHVFYQCEKTNQIYEAKYC